MDSHNDSTPVSRMTPAVADARQRVIDARAAFRRGEITYAELVRVADEYIAAVAAHVATAGTPEMRRRWRQPSRAYIIRAL